MADAGTKGELRVQAVAWCTAQATPLHTGSIAGRLQASSEPARTAHHVGLEAAALSHGTRDDGGAGGGKGELEEPAGRWRGDVWVGQEMCGWVRRGAGEQHGSTNM